MRVLLLGGSGLLSGAARAALLAAGHDVTVVTRGAFGLPDAPRLRRLRGDRREADSLSAALAGERFDFTVDFLAYDGGDVERLLAVRGFAPGRLVAISTGQVYLVTAVQRPPFREVESFGPLMPEPAPGTRDHREWTYGMGKRAMETALQRARLERGIETVALRLPVVQGAADGSLRLWAWIERMRDGGPVLLPEGGSQLVRFVHADDVARALLALASLAAAPPAALNWAMAEDVPLGAFLADVATLAGQRPRFVPVGAEALAQAGLADSCAPYWGRWCSRPDPSAAAALLGLRPEGPSAWLPGVVRAHLESPPSASHPGYAQRAAEIALCERLDAKG